MKKIVLLLSIFFVLVGCNSKMLKENYDKMQVNKDGINGYHIDLRIYGTVGNNKVNEIVKATNYNDNQYKIIIMGTNNVLSNDIKRDNEQEKNGDESKEDIVTTAASVLELGTASNLEKSIYIKDKKIYTTDMSGRYTETEKSFYSNTKAYLESLNRIKKVIKQSKEIIGDNTYNVYKVVFNKGIINEILKDTPIELEVKSDIEGIVYTDKNKYVYRIIYKIDGLTINVNYYGIDTVKKINFPIEI